MIDTNDIVIIKDECPTIKYKVMDGFEIRNKETVSDSGVMTITIGGIYAELLRLDLNEIHWERFSNLIKVG